MKKGKNIFFSLSAPSTCLSINIQFFIRATRVILRHRKNLAEKAIFNRLFYMKKLFTHRLEEELMKAENINNSKERTPKYDKLCEFWVKGRLKKLF